MFDRYTLKSQDILQNYFHKNNKIDRRRSLTLHPEYLICIINIEGG